jgi:Predicted transcriptional regulators containing the CopG/Arc/MetJ DNA-binding domain and a metal-binding domain
MNQDDDLSRVGISIPKNLLDRFDEVLDLRGYSSRSEGIRDAIRTYITYFQWMADVKGERKGIITMVYDCGQRGLVETLTDIQHDYSSLINTSLHTDVSGTRSLEVILVHGEGSEIKTFAEKLMSQKGVETVKITTIRLDV